MRAPRRGPMTSRELVDAVDAADLGVYEPGDDPLTVACNAEYHNRLRAFLADLGLDPIDWLRARVAVKLNSWETRHG